MLITKRPVLREEPISDYRSRFVLEPLEPGFGYTLGNSIRRTLLSSIPGAAVTSIKIDGIQHEFSTIEGVKEDVTEIILNVKSLVVSIDGDDVATAYIHRTGPGLVTVASCMWNSGCLTAKAITTLLEKVHELLTLLEHVSAFTYA